MTAAATIGFKKSIYYAFNTAPVIRRSQVKSGGWADRQLNMVFGFQSQSERIQFLQSAKPAELSLAGAAFANFSLAVFGTMVSILGTGAWCLGEALGWDPRQLAVGGITCSSFSCLFWLAGGLIGTATLDNFLERSAVPRFSRDVPEGDLLIKFFRRVAFGFFGAITVLLGSELMISAGAMFGTAMGLHFCAIGWLFIADQFLRFRGDLCNQLVGMRG